MHYPVFNIYKIAAMSEERQLRTFFQRVVYAWQFQSGSATFKGQRISTRSECYLCDKNPGIQIITSAGRKYVASHNGVVFATGSMDDKKAAVNMYCECPI